MSNGDEGPPADATAGRPTRRGSALRRKEEAEVGASAARRRARARRLLAAAAAVGKAASGGPGSWQDREAAARPALRRAAAGRRVPGAMRRRRNAAWRALLAPAGGFARAPAAGLSRAAAGPRMGWLPAATDGGRRAAATRPHTVRFAGQVVAAAADGSAQTEPLGGRPRERPPKNHLGHLRRGLRQRFEEAQRPALPPAPAPLVPLPEVPKMRIAGVLSLPDRLRLCQASCGIAWNLESSPCRLAEAPEVDLRGAALLQQLEGARPHRGANADVDPGLGLGSGYQLAMLREKLHHSASNCTQCGALVTKQTPDIRPLQEGWAAAEHALRDQLAALWGQLQARVARCTDLPAAVGEHNDDAPDGSLSPLVVEDRGDDCELANGFNAFDVLLEGAVGLRALPALPALTDGPLGFGAPAWLRGGKGSADMPRAHVGEIEWGDLQAIIPQRCAEERSLVALRGVGPAAAGDTTAPAGTDGDGFGDVGGRSAPCGGDGVGVGFLSAGELLEAAAASRLAPAAAGPLPGAPLEAPQ
ncbi:unnamed protein product, partial [Prorocentrum cordatum]